MSNEYGLDDPQPGITGCWHCGTTCPWTNTTQPPLTHEIAHLWFQAHQQVCPTADWPEADIPA